MLSVPSVLGIISGMAAVFISACSVYAESRGWAPTADISGIRDVYRVIMASDGALYAGTGPDGGIYRTGDGGGEWRHLVDLGGADDVLALLEASDGSLYAATTPNGYVYRTTDGGANWERTGSVGGEREAKCMVQAPDGAIYVGTGLRGGVYRSDDGGASWEKTAELVGADFVYSLCVADDGTIYAGTDGSVFATADGGKKWKPTAALPGASYVYSLMQASDGAVYAGGAGRVFRTTDGGESWASSPPLGPRSYAVYALLEDEGGTVYAASGADGAIYRFTGGEAWEKAASLDGVENIYCLVAGAEGTYYAGLRLSSGAGAVCRYAPFLGLNAAQGPLRPGDGFSVDLSAQRLTKRFDAYLVVEGPAGIYSFQGVDSGNLVPGVMPFARAINGLAGPLGLRVASLDHIPEGAPAGEYSVIAAFVHSGADPSQAKSIIPGYEDVRRVVVER